MPAWLYDSGPHGLWVFLGLTVLFGGAAAWVTGKAIAETWRPWWLLPIYMLLLAGAVRFLHYALFEEPFWAAGNLLVDWVVLLGAALLGHRTARAAAMARQYDWLYRRSGWLGFAPQAGSGNPRTASDSE